MRTTFIDFTIFIEGAANVKLPKFLGNCLEENVNVMYGGNVTTVTILRLIKLRIPVYFLVYMMSHITRF